ncbi:MAG TPA: hypothetical protein VN761_01965 [Candidatus Polarisedimenticolia bacterium]|nr:hypothetical protein [Candidatus Polarisedimenticolia bacterium]
MRLTVAVALVLFFAAAFQLPSRAAPANAATNSAAVFKEATTLDPHLETNLVTLAKIAGPAKESKKKEKSAKKQARQSEDLKDAPMAELQKLFVADEPKHEARAVTAIGELAREALQANDAAARAARESDILEIQAGLRSARLPLVPEKLTTLTTCIFFFKHISSPAIAHGDTVATDLATTKIHDGGSADPLPSTFWARPPSIAREDLYAGFGRDKLPHFETLIYDYSAPKTSSGTHGGFDVEHDGQRFKIKFGEVNSEPFTARIFDALGYHVDPTDFAPEIKVRYSRRIFREFHLRKPLTMWIAPLGIKLWAVQLQPHYDPFTFVTSAVFKDGRKVSGAELKQMLFTNPNQSHPEESAENFRPEVESALDCLVMAPANVQPRDGPTESIGAWQFGGLGHEDRRELRGMGLLAAWLSWFDSRTDNTKLRLVRDADEVQVEHFVSDLGGGMGTGTGLFSPRGENPNDLTWTFTEPEIVRGPGRMTTPFRITHFKPTVPTPAFAAMTMDDARWMARLIGQLTENQIREALIASGYDNAEARLYLEKLLSRRDQMIRDLKLENEVPLLRPDLKSRDLTYYPPVDGPFTANVSGGASVSARESSRAIDRGKLVDKSVALQTELSRRSIP